MISLKKKDHLFIFAKILILNQKMNNSLFWGSNWMYLVLFNFLIKINGYTFDVIFIILLIFHAFL